MCSDVKLKVNTESEITQSLIGVETTMNTRFTLQSGDQYFGSSSETIRNEPFPPPLSTGPVLTLIDNRPSHNRIGLNSNFGAQNMARSSPRSAISGEFDRLTVTPPLSPSDRLVGASNLGSTEGDTTAR